MRVKAVGFFAVKGKLGDRCVEVGNKEILFALLGELGKLFLLLNGGVERIEHQLRLIELRGKAVDFSAVLLVTICHVLSDRRRKERLAVLSGDNDKHLAELPEARRFHDAEDAAHDCFLPKLQL